MDEFIELNVLKTNYSTYLLPPEKDPGYELAAIHFTSGKAISNQIVIYAEPSSPYIIAKDVAETYEAAIFKLILMLTQETTYDRFYSYDYIYNLLCQENA